jgi:hypothetical protein
MASTSSSAMSSAVTLRNALARSNQSNGDGPVTIARSKLASALPTASIVTPPKIRSNCRR